MCTMPLHFVQGGLAISIDVCNSDYHTQFYDFANWAHAVPFYLKSLYHIFCMRKTNSGITSSEKSSLPSSELIAVSLESALSYIWHCIASFVYMSTLLSRSPEYFFILSSHYSLRWVILLYSVLHKIVYPERSANRPIRTNAGLIQPGQLDWVTRNPSSITHQQCPRGGHPLSHLATCITS